MNINPNSNLNLNETWTYSFATLTVHQDDGGGHVSTWTISEPVNIAVGGPVKETEGGRTSGVEVGEGLDFRVVIPSRVQEGFDVVHGRVVTCGTKYARAVALFRVFDELAGMEEETLAKDGGPEECGAGIGELEEVPDEARLTWSNIRLSCMRKAGA